MLISNIVLNYSVICCRLSIQVQSIYVNSLFLFAKIAFEFNIAHGSLHAMLTLAFTLQRMETMPLKSSGHSPPHQKTHISRIKVNLEKLTEEDRPQNDERDSLKILRKKRMQKRRKQNLLNVQRKT